MTKFLKIVFCSLLTFLPFYILFAQEGQEEKVIVDSLYREDQFYFGITYNILGSKPNDVALRGLSGGLQLGYLRDMPINKRRNLAIAIGAGLSIDTFGQNIAIGETQTNEVTFTVLDSDTSFDRNRFTMYAVEAPFEFRWRSSTPKDYKFWRVYAGFRVGYAFYYKAVFDQDGNTISLTDISQFDPVRLTATLSFGYNTFNLFASYSINPFFENAATTTGEAVELRTIKLGLIFYIL